MVQSDEVTGLLRRVSRAQLELDEFLSGYGERSGAEQALAVLADVREHLRALVSDPLKSGRPPESLLTQPAPVVVVRRSTAHQYGVEFRKQAVRHALESIILENGGRFTAANILNRAGEAGASAFSTYSGAIGKQLSAVLQDEEFTSSVLPDGWSVRTDPPAYTGGKVVPRTWTVEHRSMPVPQPVHVSTKRTYRSASEYSRVTVPLGEELRYPRTPSTVSECRELLAAVSSQDVVAMTAAEVAALVSHIVKRPSPTTVERLLAEQQRYAYDCLGLTVVSHTDSPQLPRSPRLWTVYPDSAPPPALLSSRRFILALQAEAAVLHGVALAAELVRTKYNLPYPRHLSNAYQSPFRRYLRSLGVVPHKAEVGWFDLMSRIGYESRAVLLQDSAVLVRGSSRKFSISRSDHPVS